MAWLISVAAWSAHRFIALAWQLPLVWVLERATSRSQLAIPKQLRSVMFVLIATPIFSATYLAMMGLYHLTPRWHALTLANIGGLSNHPVLLTLLSAVIYLILNDFLIYWAHRAQHSIPFLWRFHAMHHSIRDLSALNNYAHWTEELVMYVLKILPSVVLIRLSPNPASILVIGMFVTFHQIYIHSNSKVNFGRWSWLLNDNVRHRIHHSLQPEHFHRNYSITFGFWDHLFGTAYVPSKGQWPDTGLDDRAEPTGPITYLGWSFMRGSPADPGQLQPALSTVTEPATSEQR